MAPKNLASVCGEFSGGMIAEGTECIVVLKRGGEEVSKTDVVSVAPKEDPKTLIESISELSGITVAEIEIFVYAICGGARGRDM